MNQYRVELQTKPGTFEQYACTLRIWASDEAHAQALAMNRILNGAFRDHNASMWRTRRITLVEVGNQEPTP